MSTDPLAFVGHAMMFLRLPDDVVSDWAEDTEYDD
jgi:hypothetical protein